MELEGLGNIISIKNSVGAIFGVEVYDTTAAMHVGEHFDNVAGKGIVQARVYVERVNHPAIYFALSLMEVAIKAEKVHIDADMTGGRRLLHIGGEWPMSGSKNLEGKKTGRKRIWMMGGVDELFCFYTLGSAQDAMIELCLEGPPDSSPSQSQINKPRIRFLENETPIIYRAFMVLAHAVLSDQKMELYKL